MKLKIFIDKNHEEEILIYAHEKSALIDSIEKLLSDEGEPLVGYTEKEAVRLDVTDVYCFTVEDNKVCAVTEKEKLRLKERLYQIEERLPDNFIKINQSCIANIRKIERFDSSISGTLSVIFKNGHRDYVSRRNLKHVKERLGLK